MGAEVAKVGLTPKAENFARHMAGGRSAVESYRAAYDVGATTLPATVKRKAHEVAHTPKVAARIAELQAEAARPFVADAQVMIQRLYEIAYEADPEDLVSVTPCPCAECWPDDATLATAMDRWLADPDLPVPNVRLPRSDCPSAPHRHQRVEITNTAQLRGASRRLYAGARQRPDGSIEIQLEDRHAARQELHRLLGLVVNRSESRTVAVHVEPLKDLTPEQVLEFMTRQKLIT